MNKLIPQHKQMAMGTSTPTKPPARYAVGGQVRALPTSPITEAKRADGIPDLKRGGRARRG